MNWIQAYINAIKTNLPRNQREDIASELEALLEESLEEDTGKASSELIAIVSDSMEHAGQADRLVGIVNTSARTVLVTIALVSLFEAGRDIWRMIQLGGRRLTP